MHSPQKRGWRRKILLYGTVLFAVLSCAWIGWEDAKAWVKPWLKPWVDEMRGRGTLSKVSVTPRFRVGKVSGIRLQSPTVLQFGPDGRLYVAGQFGRLHAYKIERRGRADYRAVDVEEIDLVRQIPNHGDDGRAVPVEGRQVTGFYVTGTAEAPVLYVGSSDPRIGGAGMGGGVDHGLDSNSGILSRLERRAGEWSKVDLVRGLPRSAHNHSINGIQVDRARKVLYLAVGGNTNAGAPSNKFTYLPEFALSAAVLSVDLGYIEALPSRDDGEGAYKYDLPTLDDPARENSPEGGDIGDPFGSNEGLNQAVLSPEGPVKVWASGLRNAYDLVLTEVSGREGRLYAIDNGPNASWGGWPVGEGPGGACSNAYDRREPGRTANNNGLHLLTEGYYAGHPNPIRGNPLGAGWHLSGGDSLFTGGLSADWPPVPADAGRPIECDFLQPGEEDGALISYPGSVNGIAEYRASNFGGGLRGDLLLAQFTGKIYRAVLDDSGRRVVNGVEMIAEGINGAVLDVSAQGDEGPFPGTVWAALYQPSGVIVLEPVDYGGTIAPCDGGDGIAVDEDGDGFDNAAELAAGTDPCSGASRPRDADNDGVADRADPDDDNDGVSDRTDMFPLDPLDGKGNRPPLAYTMNNNNPGTGFWGLGFTGLMQAGDYLDAFDEDGLITGGAAGLLTLREVGRGTAFGAANTQRNAFHFALDLSGREEGLVFRCRLAGPFFQGCGEEGECLQGFYLGTGSQDDFLWLGLVQRGGRPEAQVRLEIGGRQGLRQAVSLGSLVEDHQVDLVLRLAVNGNVHAEILTPARGRLAVAEGIEPVGGLAPAFQGRVPLAVGIMAGTSAAAFPATWDEISVDVSEGGTHAE